MSAKDRASHQKIMDIAIDNLKIAIALGDSTATEISRAAGLSPNVLGKFLRRETSISFENMIAVCEVMDLPIGVISSGARITPERLRLHRAIVRLPEDRLEEAMDLLPKPGRRKGA
jgi:hypothetical protein